MLRFNKVDLAKAQADFQAGRHVSTHSESIDGPIYVSSSEGEGPSDDDQTRPPTPTPVSPQNIAAAGAAAAARFCSHPALGAGAYSNVSDDENIAPQPQLLSGSDDGQSDGSHESEVIVRSEDDDNASLDPPSPVGDDKFELNSARGAGAAAKDQRIREFTTADGGRGFDMLSDGSSVVDFAVDDSDDNSDYKERPPKCARMSVGSTKSPLLGAGAAPPPALVAGAAPLGAGAAPLPALEAEAQQDVVGGKRKQPENENGPVLAVVFCNTDDLVPRQVIRLHSARRTAVPGMILVTYRTTFWTVESKHVMLVDFDEFEAAPKHKRNKDEVRGVKAEELVASINTVPAHI
jgi:hypothetical protein